MTTTAVTPDIKIDRDPLRILSITANLLPTEITDARREHKLRWLVAGGLVVVVAALGFWDFTARQQTSDQQSTLNHTQAEVSKLQSEMDQPQFAQLSKVKSQGAAISTQLNKLMAQDVAWYQLVPSLLSNGQTAGVVLTNIDGKLSSANPSAAGQTTTPTSGTNTSDAGTLQIIGLSPDKPQVAAFLDALAKVPGLSDPFLTNLTSQTGGYQFSLNVTFTSALYTGRFTPTTNGGK
jgi:Tfp pilus assembly protein PilN